MLGSMAKAELTDEERELLLQKTVLADQEKQKRTSIATKFLKVCAQREVGESGK